jgi:hypothetical protein
MEKKMKKILLLTTLLASSLCFADENKGMIVQAECRADSGLGIVEIKTINDNESISTWHKVKSKKLCGNTSPHPMFIGGASLLVSKAADNITNSTMDSSKLFFNNTGFLVDIEYDKNVHISSIVGDKSQTHINRENVHKWYFSPKIIDQQGCWLEYGF